MAYGHDLEWGGRTILSSLAGKEMAVIPLVKARSCLPGGDRVFLVKCREYGFATTYATEAEGVL